MISVVPARKRTGLPWDSHVLREKAMGRRLRLYSRVIFSRESNLFSVDALFVERWCLLEVSKKNEYGPKKTEDQMEREKKEKWSGFILFRTLFQALLTEWVGGHMFFVK